MAQTALSPATFTAGCRMPEKPGSREGLAQPCLPNVQEARLDVPSSRCISPEQGQEAGNADSEEGGSRGVSAPRLEGHPVQTWEGHLQGCGEVMRVVHPPLAPRPLWKPTSLGRCQASL